jgi:hypothetical protein
MKQRNVVLRKKNIIEYVNDDELLLSSSRVVLEVSEREYLFYKTMRDIVERTYRQTFHLQYINQSNDSKNQVIYKLEEAFPEQWSMRHVRIGVEKTYNNKKESFKK